MLDRAGGKFKVCCESWLVPELMIQGCKCDQKLKRRPCGTCSNTCLKRNSKKDNSKFLKTNGSVMKVESIAECSLGAFWSIKR